MIGTVWPYLAVMLLAAGLFPFLEKRLQWRLFTVLPPIVLTYLLVTALAVGGLWSPTTEVQTAQRALTTHLLPALLFLLMVTCDLRAVLRLGPRVLAVFAVAMASILIAIVIVYLLFRSALPSDGWKMLAALSATWTGGSANLVAVKQIIGLSENSLPSVLLADALVRYLVIHWPAGLRGRSERTAFVAHRFREVHGVASPEWQIIVEPTAGKFPALACAAPAVLIDAVAEWARRHRVRLAGLSGEFVAAYNRARLRVSHRFGALGLQRGGRLTIGVQTSARDIPDWDSLRHIELLVAVEQEFRVRFNTGEVAGLKNVGEMVDLIAAKRAGGAFA